MVPEPVEVRVIVPLPVFIVPAKAIEELVPLSVRVTAPLLLVVRPPEPTVMVAELALSVSETEAGLLVVLVMETAEAVSVRVTAAVVFKEMV